jgi:hypothetical protein
MKKSLLVQMLVFYAQEKEKHHIEHIKVERTNYLLYEEDVDLWVNHASGAANTKIVKGKLVFGCEYLVSRGEELGFGLKPDIVCEYNRHWPFDFCYLYKL